MTPERPPSTEARPADLTDAEFQALDDLLLETPGGAVLDAPMLDGFLCGVIVQPELIEPARWLPFVFDPEGAPLPETTDAAWQARATELILRRHAAVLRSIAEDGDFDPAVIEPEDEADEPPEEPGDEGPDPWATLPPISRALAPWVAGFQIAATDFPGLIELDDDAVSLALARLFRHLPAEDEPQREINALLDQERPLADLEEAVVDLVEAVVELHDLTGEQRYRVETVRRETPKVGRNEPCPCGSGKKYKHCHGQD